MTFKELITQCGYRIDETIDTTSTDAKVILMINKLKSGINTAYKTIAKDKLLLQTKDTITLENSIFNTEYLTNTFYKINKITDLEGNELEFTSIGDNEYKVDTLETSIILYYYYLPKALSGMSDNIKLPSSIDPMILAYYACYEYLNMEGDDEERLKAKDNLNAYTVAYNSIRKPAMYASIIDRYGGDILD